MDLLLLMGTALSGRNATLFIMVITTLLLLAFCIMALRLRKYVIGTLGEASSSVISKFVIPPEMGGSTSAVSTGGGGGSGGGGAVSGAMSSVVSGLNKGSGTGGGLAGKIAGVGLAGAGIAGGNFIANSGGHASVGTGDGSGGGVGGSGGSGGDTSMLASSSSTQNNNSASNSSMNANEKGMAAGSLTNAGNAYAQSAGANVNAESVQGDVAKGDNAVGAGAMGVATGAERMDGSMRTESRQEMADRETGSQLMQAESLASVSSRHGLDANVDANAVSSVATGTGSDTNGMRQVSSDMQSDGNRRDVHSGMSEQDEQGQGMDQSEGVYRDQNDPRNVHAGAMNNGPMEGQDGMYGDVDNKGRTLGESANAVANAGSIYGMGEQTGNTKDVRMGMVNGSPDASDGYAANYSSMYGGSQSLEATVHGVQAGSENGRVVAMPGQGANGANSQSGANANANANTNANINNGVRGIQAGAEHNGSMNNMNDQAGRDGQMAGQGTGQQVGRGVNGQNSQNGIRGISVGQAAANAMSHSDSKGVGGRMDARSQSQRQGNAGSQQGQMYRQVSSQGQNNPMRVPLSASANSAAGGMRGAGQSIHAVGGAGGRNMNGNSNRNNSSMSANVNAFASSRGMGVGGSSQFGVGGYRAGVSAAHAVGGAGGMGMSGNGRYAMPTSGYGQNRQNRQPSDPRDRNDNRNMGSGVHLDEPRGSATHDVGGMSLGAAAQGVRSGHGGEFGRGMTQQSGAYRHSSSGSSDDFI